MLTLMSQRDLPQLRSLDSQDEQSLSLEKFQGEKKSLSRLVDEEIVFEKSNGSDSDNDNDKNDNRENGGNEKLSNEEIAGDASCSSTTPTANSWTVSGEDKIINHNNERDRKEENGDRKPAAVDAQGGALNGGPSSDSTGRTAAYFNTNQNTPSNQVGSPSKSTPDTSSSLSTGPPPLISPIQEQFLAVTGNKAARKSLQKKLQSPASPIASPTAQAIQVLPDFSDFQNDPPSPQTHSLFASLPPSNSHREQNDESPKQLSLPISQATRGSEGTLSPTRPRQLEPSLSSLPMSKTNPAKQISMVGNVKKLKQPPPGSQTQTPLKTQPQTQKQTPLQTQPHQAAHENFAGGLGHVRPHNPPQKLHRQKGNLHVNAAASAATPLPGNIFVQNRKIPGVAMQRPHGRQPPFTVSDETIQAAAMANQIQRQQRQNQRQKLKMQRLQQQQQEMQRKQILAENERAKQQQLDNSGTSGDSNSEQDVSIALSDDLGNDSIVGSSSFRLAHKVLEREVLPELTRTGHSRGSMSRAQPSRRISKMEKDLSSIVSDPALKMPASEPGAAVSTRRVVPAKASSALAKRRRMFQRKKSSRVIHNTATLSSFRSGISSVTMDEAMKAAARRKAQEQAATMPLNFDIKQVTLDNPSSTHSSLGFHSASMRSILDANFAQFSGEASTEELQNTKHSNCYGHFSTQLTPHLEGDSATGGLNNSTNSLDASSAITPPTREQMRKRRESVRAQPRLAGHRPSLQGDERSQVSKTSQVSKISVAPSLLSRRRTSGTSAGLRRLPPEKGGNGQNLVFEQSPLPVPTVVDPAKFMRGLNKEAKKDVHHKVIDEQNDLIMKLACQLSAQENQNKVQKQQQLHPPKSPEKRFTDGEVTCRSHSTPEPVSIHSGSYNTQLALLLQQQIASGSDHLASLPSQTTVPNSFDATDTALRLALEESKKDIFCRPQLVDAESDRALEVALEVSRREAEEANRYKHAHAIPYSLDLSSQPLQRKDERREVLAPKAPLELKGTAVASEVAGTLDVALELSKKEYDFEVAKRHRRGKIIPTAANSADHRKELEQELVMPADMLEDDSSIRDWKAPASSPSAGEDHALAIALAASRMDALTSPPSIPAGLSREAPRRPNRYIRSDTKRNAADLQRRNHPSADTGEIDETLALSMALSKMEMYTIDDNTKDAPEQIALRLSQDEAMAMALEMSRRAPGAFDSPFASNSRSSPPCTPARQPLAATRPTSMPPPHHGYSSIPDPNIYTRSPIPFSPVPSFTTSAAFPQYYEQSHYNPHPFSPPLIHPAYHQPPHSYYQNAFSHHQSLPPQHGYPQNPSPLQSYHGHPDYCSYYSPPATPAAPQVPAASDDQDEALKMALAMSYQEAFGEPPANPQNSTAALSSADDDSLAVALAISRREAYGGGH